VIEPAYFAIGTSVVSTAVAVMALVASRGDKNDSRFAEVAKSMSDLNSQMASFGTQMANLRTELAQQELTRLRELDTRYLTRREFEPHSELVAFATKLTVETHKRLHPDAVVQEPPRFRG